MKRKIESSLRQFKNLQPSAAFQEDAKRRLFARIEKQDSPWVIRLLKNIFKPLPDAEFAANAMMRLLHKIEEQPLSLAERLRAFIQNTLLQRQYLATALAGVFLFVFVIYAPSTQANAKTEIFVTAGDVQVKSLGENWRDIDAKAILKIGDQVKTLTDASADIYFSDYSVVRIAENTHVNVANFLQKNEDNSPIILQLQEGRIWSSIISQKQDFYVETRHSRVSTSFGVFDVEANGSTMVRSIQHTVNVEPRSADTDNILLSAGFETELSETGGLSTASLTKKDEWMTANQMKDENLRVKALQQGIEAERKLAGALPGTALYNVTQVVNSLGAIELKDIQRQFASAKVLFEIGSTELALQQFAQAQENLKVYWTESEQTDEVLSFLEKEKTFFSQILPGDSLFLLKERYNEMFVTFAANPAQEELNQVSEKLIEVQNLVVRPEIESDKLVVALNEFIMDNHVVSDATLVTGEEDKLKKLLSLQNENLKVLQELAPNIEDEEMQKKAAATRKELVNTIEKIVAKIAPEQNTGLSTNQNQADWFARQIQTLVEKVETYESPRGRTNTIHWILEDIDNSEVNLGLLYTLRDAMPEDVRLPISQKILKIRQSGR